MNATDRSASESCAQLKYGSSLPFGQCAGEPQIDKSERVRVTNVQNTWGVRAQAMQTLYQLSLQSLNPYAALQRPTDHVISGLGPP